METMTVLSRDMFDRTLKINTADEAVGILLGYGHFRTLGDVLRRFVPEPDIKKHLVAGLQLWFPGDKAAMEEFESIKRQSKGYAGSYGIVKHWFLGKYQEKYLSHKAAKASNE